MSLPESTALLGLLVDAFDARTATGSNVRFLKDRSSARAFSGSVRTRHWCCRLNAFIDYLIEKRVVVVGAVPSELGRSALFLVFASAMKSWDAVAPHATAPLRAHLRFLALDLAAKVSGLQRIGFDFGIQYACDDRLPAWGDRARRSEPLEPLRMGKTLNDLSACIGCRPHTVGDWFSRGVRPTNESLELLAGLLAERGLGEVDVIRRGLLVHYSMGDLVGFLSSPQGAATDPWLSADEAVDVARVVSGLVRCASGRDAGDARDALRECFITPPASWLESARSHGASEQWAADFMLAKRDYERAGIIEAGRDFAMPASQLARVLVQLPVRRDACAEHRRARRKWVAALMGAVPSLPHDTRRAVTKAGG